MIKAYGEIACNSGANPAAHQFTLAVTLVLNTL
jgi:hypothetical protein